MTPSFASGPYDYDRPAFSDKMHAWRLQDTSAGAMLTRPSITGMAPELLKMFTRNYVTTPRPDPLTRNATGDGAAGKSMANAAAITMQETFEEDDFDQFDLGPGFDDANAPALNMGTAEEITPPEDNLSVIESVAPDMDGFGEDFADTKGIEPM